MNEDIYICLLCVEAVVFVMSTVVKAHPKMCVCCNLKQVIQVHNILYEVVTSCGNFSYSRAPGYKGGTLIQG